jgi:hypothetical protein
MNYRDVYDNGEPKITNDDLMRVQLSNQNVLNNIFDDLVEEVGNGFIVSGCEINIGSVGSDIEVTEGYIYVSGKLIKVDATSITRQAGYVYWLADTTSYNSDGTKTFIDGTNRQTWRNQRGTIIASSSFSGDAKTVALIVSSGVDISKRYGSYVSTNKYKVLEIDADGTYQMTIQDSVIVTGGAGSVVVKFPDSDDSYVGKQIRILNRTAYGMTIQTSAGGTQYPTTIASDYYATFEYIGTEWICTFYDERPIA